MRGFQILSYHCGTRGCGAGYSYTQLKGQRGIQKVSTGSCPKKQSNSDLTLYFTVTLELVQTYCVLLQLIITSMENVSIYLIFIADSMKDLQITNYLGAQKCLILLSLSVLSCLSPTLCPCPPAALQLGWTEQVAQKVHKPACLSMVEGSRSQLKPSKTA